MRSGAPAGTARVPAARKRFGWLAGALLVAVALLSLGQRLWTRPRPEASSPLVAGRTGQPIDLLLVTVDTLRADALGYAGNTIVRTPLIDRLAAAGRSFPRTHAHNVVTLPSHTNILTGLYPYQHGVRDNSGFRLAPTVPTLATLLRERGYQTAAVVSAFPLDHQFGLARGFDLYDDRYPKGSHPTDFEIAERRGDESVAHAVAWWRAHDGAPRFLWVHLYDPHAPYDAPEPFRSRLPKSPYLAEVEAADSFLQPLLNPVLDGGARPALIVFTADHGESLGQHGELTHGLFAYEPTLHVPLLLWGQGVEPGVDVRWSRHVDILPTLLDAAGATPRPGMPGNSLLRPAPSEAETQSYFEAMSGNLNRGWAPLRGLLRRGNKGIELPLPELYDLQSDPAEERNLVDVERSTARGLFAALPTESSWPPERARLTSEQEANLRSLGYFTGEATTRAHYAPEDDPKRLIALDRKIQRVYELYERRQLDEAARLAREIVGERPGMALGYSQLAQVLLEQAKPNEAIAVMREAVNKRLASESLHRQLGLTLSEAGRHDEALAVLAPLADVPDPAPETLDAYGLALSDSGRQELAKTVLERSTTLDANNAVGYEHLSIVALRERDWPAARDHARHALELNPNLPLAENNLGVALYYLGQRADAFAAWERAVALDPGQYDTLYNLGFKYAEAQQLAPARRVLELFVATAPPVRYRRDIAEARALLRRLNS